MTSEELCKDEQGYSIHCIDCKKKIGYGIKAICDMKPRCTKCALKEFGI